MLSTRHYEPEHSHTDGLKVPTSSQEDAGEDLIEILLHSNGHELTRIPLITITDRRPNTRSTIVQNY